MTRRRAELALAGITFLWGATFVLVKSALADISTILFLTLRFGVAALALLAIYYQKLRREGIWPGVGAGALMFAAYVFQTWGLELTTASKSAFLTGLSIPMVPLASSIVYKSRPRLMEIAGIIVASAGMALMTLPAGHFAVGLGDLLSLLCAVTFALHIVFVSHYSPLVGFETLSVLQVATAALLGAVFSGFAEPVRFSWNAGVASAVLITGLFATAVAFTTMAWAQKYTTATRSALIFSLEPVVAWVTSWLLLSEMMPVRGRIGAAVILAGILLVEMKSGRVETDVTKETSI